MSKHNKTNKVIDDAKKMVFFGVSGDKFKSTRRFKIDMDKFSNNKMSEIFASRDADRMAKLEQDGEECKCYAPILQILF